MTTYTFRLRQTTETDRPWSLTMNSIHANTLLPSSVGSGIREVIVIGGAGRPHRASTAPARSQRAALSVALVEHELVCGECPMGLHPVQELRCARWSGFARRQRRGRATAKVGPARLVLLALVLCRYKHGFEILRAGQGVGVDRGTWNRPDSRSAGRLAGTARVDVDGVRYTAETRSRGYRL